MIIQPFTLQDNPEERLQHLHQHVEERVPAVPRALHRDGAAHRHEPALPPAQGHEDHAAAALLGAQVSGGRHFQALFRCWFVCVTHNQNRRG